MAQSTRPKHRKFLIAESSTAKSALITGGSSGIGASNRQLCRRRRDRRRHAAQRQDREITRKDLPVSKWSCLDQANTAASKALVDQVKANMAVSTFCS